ncbi:MAG: ABC transporter ATP-binding protein [Paracoccaceae bacterium]
MTVSVKDLTLKFGQTTVLDNLNIEIADGEFLVLLGASGCGKSTLLNCIAGLLEITEGQLFIGGKNVTWEEPAKRGIGMVFQSYALYPQMSVRGNLSFGLKIAGLPKDEIEKRVARASEILQIGPLLDRKPAALSGGQRQRVAIGRALVRDVDVFLFDEPLSNLDAKLRADLRVELKRLHQRLKNTMIYVTHDQIEAMTLADRVVVMNHGVIEQVGAPNDLYHSPATRFVAGFIGSPAMNLIPCRLEQAAGALRLRLSSTIEFPVPESRTQRYRPHVGKELVFGLRPEHITERRQEHAGESHPFEATLDVTEPMGMETLIYFTIDGNEICGRVDPLAGAGAGKPMRLAANLRHMHLIDAASGVVI